MLAKRCLIHSYRTANSLYRKGMMGLHSLIADGQLRKVRRGKRDSCWCGGSLLPFKWHASYRVCAACGTYVNIVPPITDDLEHLYSLKVFWKTRQRLRGHPTIENRASLYIADGRVDQWLALIKKYGPQKGQVIEVGCAPGVLLHELGKRGYECIGVEISDDVAEWIRSTTHLDVRPGFFPGVDLPPCHLFLAFDVLEHSPSPKDFMQEVHRILLPEGIAIIQTVVDRYDFNPPLGERFADIFDDLEHLFLFTNNAIKALALEAGLEIISLDERIWLAGEVVVFKKP
jgi:SAM-dependent methyltransferase